MPTLTRVAVALAVALASAAPILGQEPKPKPVPKDSMRVYIPGCAKGYMFTVGRTPADESTSTSGLPDGLHLRMSGKKELMAEIKAREGSRLEITGIMKKDQYAPGIAIGGGVRIGPGSNSPGGRPSPVADQIMIDVESWRQIEGRCPSR